MNKPTIIGIAGGTGSGKTSVTRKIISSLEEHDITLIEQDFYYKDQSHKTMEERLETNYDHPFAFDNDLLIQHVKSLINRESVELPTYDYVNHTRIDQTINVQHKYGIIREDIFALENEQLQNLLDVKIYADTDSDIRILRRMSRDIKELGRSMEPVINQYLSVVRPMH